MRIEYQEIFYFRFLISAVTKLWKEHLYIMKHKILKRALGLTLACFLMFQFFAPTAIGAELFGEEIQGSLSVSPASLSPTAAAGSSTVSVSATVSWDFTTSSSGWLSASKISNSSFKISWTANTGAERTGRVSLYNTTEGLTANVTVTQKAGANTITLSPGSLSFSAAGSTKYVTASSSLGMTLTASSTASWISVYPTTVASGAAFSITASANTSESARDGYVLVYSGSASSSIYVSQSGATNNISLSPSSLSFSASGDTKTVTATSSLGLTLTASSNSGWINVYPTTVASGGSFSITASANTSESARSGSVTVTSGSTYTTL